MEVLIVTKLKVQPQVRMSEQIKIDLIGDEYEIVGARARVISQK
jgi:hypothetical protein